MNENEKLLLDAILKLCKGSQLSYKEINKVLDASDEFILASILKKPVKKWGVIYCLFTFKKEGKTVSSWLLI